MKANKKTASWEFESPLPHSINNMKPVPVAGFIILEKNSATSMTQTLHIRTPKLVKAKQGWYLEYSYMIPPELRHLYRNKKWYRFRITEDMNRKRGEEKEAFANWLLNEITESLKNGYNPFQKDLDHVATVAASQTIPDFVSAQKALSIFLTAWEKRGLEIVSLAKYKKCVNRLGEWLHKNNLLYNSVKEITTHHIEQFLTDTRNFYNYSNREYNNTFDFIRTCFNYLVKKEVIKKSPCAGIDKLKTNSIKHRYYDAESLKAITGALLAADPYCYLAIQTVYYLCIRSDKELMNFKVGNILWEQNKIMLNAYGTKGKADQYIPMDDNIKELFLKHNVDKYPKDFYVFGIKGTPSPIKFGTGFFSKRFRKVRIAAGLPDSFTIYSMKHTRIIHLKQDGLSDADIMSLTRHKDFAAYAKYLRDLGLDANPEKINKVSRKV